MARTYKFGDRKSKVISEFEAYKLIQQTPKEDKLIPKPYEILRTKEGCAWHHNRKLRTKHKFKINRLCASLSEKHKEIAIYDQKQNIVRCGGFYYIIADQVKTKDELSFHKNKIEAREEDKIVISLTKSKLTPYFLLDTKTIRRYYEDYNFPAWFKPFIKMRHFRFMDCGSRFIFSSRRYNDSSKHNQSEKFRHDILKLKQIGKCYFSLARMLDSKKEAEGKGFPIKDKIYLNLDVDGECNGMHHINQLGICEKCFNSAQTKLKKVMARISMSTYPYPKQILFSGTKGFHLHFHEEVTQKYMQKFISYLNNKEELVDYFKDKDGNFDTHRIMKVPNTIDANTACLIYDDICRLDVKDEIISHS